MTAISCSLAAGDLIVCTHAAAASGSLRMDGAEFRSIIAAFNEMPGGLELSYRHATRFSADASLLATSRESIELST